MTESKQTLKQTLVIVNFLLLVALAIGAFEFRVGHASAAGSELPPGLVKGAKFQIVLNAAVGVRTETLEVLDTHGTWVHAQVIESSVWGNGEIWVNLTSVDFGYVNVIGNPTPPK